MRYLENLWNELDFGSMAALALRLAAVLLCLTVHEVSHGLAAWAMGDPTARRSRRLSLNPLHHIDWLGLAAMVLCGFGWAKPVPVDPRYFKNPKWGMALCALAGPLSNLLLAAALLLVARGCFTASLFTLGEFCFLTAMLSVGLGVFNLIPLPPLDGSKVLAALLPDRLYEKWMRYERIGMLLVFALVLLGVGDGFLSAAIDRVFYSLANLIFSL
ncbi:MAG: site-2 protease family protein [Oscillospiraceae bacterium]